MKNLTLIAASALLATALTGCGKGDDPKADVSQSFQKGPSPEVLAQMPPQARAAYEQSKQQGEAARQRNAQQWQQMYQGRK